MLTSRTDPKPESGPLARRARLSRSPFLFPILVALISASATWLITTQLERTITAQDDDRFTSVTENLRDTISRRLETYIAILRAGAGLLAASPDVTAGVPGPRRLA